MEKPIIYLIVYCIMYLIYFIIQVKIRLLNDSLHQTN